MRTEPPGPKGVPLVGNTYHYQRDPFTFMQACRDAYGDVVKLQLGPEEAYMLSNPETIEEILVHEADNYGKANFGDQAVDDLLGQGMLLSEGGQWRDQRQRAQPAFKMDRIRELTEMMTGYAEELTERWEGRDVVDIEEEMTTVTVRIIVEAMFGTDLPDETARTLRTKLEPVGERFEPSISRQLIPDFVPTEENRVYQDALKVLEGVLDDIVDQRMDDHEEGRDYLSILLRAREDGEVTDRELRDELMTMLLAGHDTTALALTYTWFLLAQHPEAMAELQAELDEVCGGDPPTFEDVFQFDYTERVIQEAMRLYPPVYTLFREPRTDVHLDGYDIPAGSALMLPQWVVHRDERWWDDPEQFDPDRFLDERMADRPDFAYFPFGGGPRSCIGRRFSLLEGQLILGTVAQQYDVSLASDPDLDLQGTLTLHPRDSVELAVEPR